MKIQPILLVLCVCLTVTSVYSAPKELNRVRAFVNGEIITQVDLDEAVKAQVGHMVRNKGITSASQAAQAVAKIEKEALNDLIDRKLILSEFKSKGFKLPEKNIDQAVNRFIQSNFGGDRDKFIESLSKQGMTLSQFRKVQEERIAVQALQGQFTDRPGDAFILPEERTKIYNEIKSEYRGTGTMRIQMITIPKLKPLRTKQQQKDLIAKLRGRIAGGERFSSVAKDYSADQFASSGGFVTDPKGNRNMDPANLSPNIVNATKYLSLETVSAVVDDGLAWRLLMVNGRTSGSVPSQTELETVIENRLVARKRKTNMEGWLKKLRRDSNIRIYD